jgi:DNA invertase Pin-like site-specific DNA recombinase
VEKRTRAAIYLRISKDDEANGLAIDRQREDCVRIIDARGWSVEGEYVDQGISASKRDVKRPAYDRMEADYRAGRFDAIVCWDLDRLTRQPRQLEDWIEAAEDRGLSVVTANGEADLSTDGGRMFARIKASVARAEIERKGARQRRANVQRIEQGRPVPGRRLFGYEIDGVTPREEEAAVVRRLFAGVVAGNSIRGMADRLNAEGVPFGTGNRRSRTGEARTPVWRPGLVRQIVNNRRYAGEVVHRGVWQQSEAVAPIMDAATAAEARAILADEKRRTSPGPRRKYLLSGIATCGVCGEPVKRMSGGRREGRVPGYMCTKSTAHVWMRAEAVEALTVQRVAEIIAEEGGEYLRATEASESMASLRERLERIERATLATARDRDEGLMSDGAARARMIELRGERGKVEAALERERMARSGSSALLSLGAGLWEHGREPIGEGLRVAEVVRESFEGLTLEQRREVVEAVAYVVLLPFRDGGGRRRGDDERVRVASRLAIEQGAEALEDGLVPFIDRGVVV